MPVAAHQEHLNGNTNGHVADQKKGSHIDKADGSSRYWQKRYVPGRDETFEVSNPVQQREAIC